MLRADRQGPQHYGVEKHLYNLQKQILDISHTCQERRHVALSWVIPSIGTLPEDTEES